MKNLKTICFIIFLIITINIKTQSIDISYSFDSLSFEKIYLYDMPFYKINMGEDFVSSVHLGHPNLPLKNIIFYTQNNNYLIVQTNIIEKDTIFLPQKDIVVSPVQKPKFKQIKKQDFCKDIKFYSTDSLLGDDIVSIHPIGQKKNNNLFIISISPLRYNPVQNMIERIKKIDIKITVDRKNNQQSINNKLSDAGVFQTNIDRPLKIVILSDTIFKNTLQPFVNWKQMQGIQPIEVYTEQTGHSAVQIKDHLKKLYASSSDLYPPFDYLLIVGDTDLIPAFEGKYVIENYPKHYTDLYYAEFTNDILPDVFYGRMSANDTITLKNIINKTIKYEMYDFPNEEFLNNSLLIAGKESSDNAPMLTNGQMNYAKQYFAIFSDTNIYYNPTSNDQINRNKIKKNLIDGNSWVNYTGHCTQTGWQLPAYKLQDIDTSLSNIDMYGIFINNCCLSGKFDDSVCFTEALLQAKNKGAVGVIGASDYTLWEEDYYWSVGSKNTALNPVYNYSKLGIYDRLFHNHNEPLHDMYITMGQILQAGNLAVTQSLSNYSNHYWEMYNLQGDPSLVPHIGVAKPFQVSIPKTITIGTTSLNLNLPPYTYVALSHNNKLITAKQADSIGNINLDISNIVIPNNINIVLTNQFYKPLIDSIKFISPSESTVVLDSITIKDITTGFQQDFLQEGHTYTISYNLVNISDNDFLSNNNIVKLIVNDNIILDNNIDNFTAINSKSSLKKENIFTFKVKEGIKNLSIAELNFNISNNNSYNKQQTIVKEIIAPDVYISACSLVNNNDTIFFAVQLTNKGRKTSDIGNLSIQNYNDEIIIENNDIEVKKLSFLQSDSIVFHILKTNTLSDTISFIVNYTSNNYIITKVYNLYLNKLTETFEENNNLFDWDFDVNYAWIITDSVSYKGNRCLRSAKNLKDNSKSQLKLVVDNDISSQISFFVKVSSELDYDNFKFFIDSKELCCLNGEIDWTELNFDIPSGKHTLCWSYEKDYKFSGGDDAVYLDNVTLMGGSKKIDFNINDIEQDEITVFPNPAKETIHINKTKIGCSITLFNSRGTPLYFCDNTMQKNEINISGFESGIYYIVITDKTGKRTTKKIIIK